MIEAKYLCSLFFVSYYSLIIPQYKFHKYSTANKMLNSSKDNMYFKLKSALICFSKRLAAHG